MGDLKKENERPLMGLLLVAVAPIYLSVAFLHWGWLVEVTSGRSLMAWGQLAAVGVTPVLCVRGLLFLLSNMTSASLKERIVHFRWNDPLPGCRSDILMLQDARIDLDALEPEVAALRDESLMPRERNARWYREVYRPVRDIPAVKNTHRTYLLHRDAAAGVFMVLAAVSVADLVGVLVWDLRIMTYVGYLVMVAYFLLIAVSANVAGKRMVTGSIANFQDAKHSGGD